MSLLTEAELIERAAENVVAAGVMFVAEDTGLVLFTLRSDNGQWAFPGGRLEDGESLAECAAREVMEETGIEVAADALMYLTRRVADGVDFTTFAAKVPTAAVPVLNDEHIGFAWLNPSVAAQWFAQGADIAEMGPPTGAPEDAAPVYTADAEFNEGDHPRDQDGKFTSGGGGGSGSPFEGTAGKFTKGLSVNMGTKGLKPRSRGDARDLTQSAQVAWGIAKSTGKPVVMVAAGRSGWQPLKPGEQPAYGQPHGVIEPNGDVTMYKVAPVDAGTASAAEYEQAAKAQPKAAEETSELPRSEREPAAAKNGRTNFESQLMDAADISRAEAGKVMELYLKEKLVWVDRGDGRITAKNGGFMERDVIHRALAMAEGRKDSVEDELLRADDYVILGVDEKAAPPEGETALADAAVAA